MNIDQCNAAKREMLVWLSDPHELGRLPSKIECAGEFDYNDMHYYIFKYKVGLFGKWLVGVCGGYKGDEIVSCGHVFSEMRKYDEATAQTECIDMINMIMAYWMRQAKLIEKQMKSNK